jgi:hypothetical protein
MSQIKKGENEPKFQDLKEHFKFTSSLTNYDMRDNPKFKSMILLLDPKHGASEVDLRSSIEMSHLRSNTLEKNFMFNETQIINAEKETRKRGRPVGLGIIEESKSRDKLAESSVSVFPDIK